MTVGIIPNLYKDTNGVVTSCVIDKLKGFNCKVLLEKGNEIVFGEDNEYCENIYSKADIIVAVGGDATIIRTAKLASYYNKPVLGVNNGTVGYMAAIELDELDLLEKLVKGEYSIEDRMLIKANQSNGDVHYCLNDLVVKNIECSGLAEIELYTNDSLTLSYSADGVIISTPTGSTAYSLSAGGPITDPNIDCFIITPICAHSIVARSVILSVGNKYKIKIKNTLHKSDKLNIKAVFDGRDEGVDFSSEKAIDFECADDRCAKLIKIKNTSFYDVLKNKLN